MTRWPGPTARAVPKDATVSQSDAVAPPWRRPKGCVFPATGMRATIRSAATWSTSKPSFSISVPPSWSSPGGTASAEDASWMWLGMGGHDDQFGPQPHQEPQQDSPDGHVPGAQPSAGEQQLGDHVEDGARGHRQERHEQVLATDRTAHDSP